MKLIRIYLHGEDTIYVDRIVNNEIYYYLLDLEKDFQQNKPYAPQFTVVVVSNFEEEDE